MKQKTVLVAFSDEWLAYSPTVLNLISALSGHCSVKTIAFDSPGYNNHQLAIPHLEFLSFSRSWLQRLGRCHLYSASKAARLYLRLLSYHADEVIAVDSLAAWVCQLRFGTCHFVSLEVTRTVFSRLLLPERINSVITQTPERFRYLFGDRDLRTYFVQNAPRLDPRQTRPHPEPNHLVYLGNIKAEHGIFICLDALRLLPGTKLTIAGIPGEPTERKIRQEYQDLLDEGRVLLHKAYIPQDDIVTYLGRFSAGFCFYDFSLIAANDFNYITCPSGKLFNYFAAGVPVIGSDIPGLSSVDEFGAGELLRNPAAEQVAAATRRVLGRRDELSVNCLRAAARYDFDRSVAPFIEQLLGSEKP
jgi:glycosyltransferase involved in cell wall biosynthesis